MRRSIVAAIPPRCTAPDARPSGSWNRPGPSWPPWPELCPNRWCSPPAAPRPMPWRWAAFPPGAARIRVSREGVADLASLEALLARDKSPALVSLMLANNETGVIQPVAEAAKLAHAHGALFHCDAIQAAGKQPIDFPALGCDLMTLSAHKLGGPMGVGALIIAAGIEITPLFRGGGQERGRRAGTEDLAGIVGVGAVCTNA